MTWGSWDNFWAMGGHGFFVWGSYALTLALMVAEPLLVAARWRRARTEARRARQREDDA